MKRMKLIAFVVLAIVAVTAQAQSEQMTVPLSEPGKPFKLNVSLLNGSIKIVGYEGKDLVIDAEPGGKRQSKDKDKDKEKDGINMNVNTNVSTNRNSENTSGMRRLANAGHGMDISAEEKNNKVTVHSNSWSKSVTLTIKVPSNGGTYNLGTTNDGDITVTNVNGEMEVSNTNGGIMLTNVTGSAVANTVNGNMIATFRAVDAKAPMAFTTLNGKVDVSFPADAKIAIKAQSERGEVYSDFDVEVDKSAPKVNRTNEKGMFRLNVEDWVRGKVNGGGPEVLLKTMNGNIYLRKSK
jgi:hypothetical protein